MIIWFIFLDLNRVFRNSVVCVLRVVSRKVGVFIYEELIIRILELLRCFKYNYSNYKGLEGIGDF